MKEQIDPGPLDRPPARRPTEAGVARRAAELAALLTSCGDTRGAAAVAREARDALAQAARPPKPRRPDLY